jgi:hypothetical protein
MEAAEAAETIRQAVEQEHAAERAEQSYVEHFRRRAALLIAVLAGLLAITTLGNEHANRHIITSNIDVADTYAFYQAKNIRQTSNVLAAADLQSLMEVTNPEDTTRAAIQKRIDGYQATAARYESEPETGEGKRELLAQATVLTKELEHAEAQSPNFVFALALFQIGLMVASVAVIAVSRTMVISAVTLGVLATLLMLNGFFLFIHLPFG